MNILASVAQFVNHYLLGNLLAAAFMFVVGALVWRFKVYSGHAEVKLSSTGNVLKDDDYIHPDIEWETSASPHPGVGEALAWERRVVPNLVGRMDEFNHLIEWVCSASGPLKIFLMTGAGGSGKSRLAAEIGEKLKHHHAFNILPSWIWSDWRSIGFLHDGLLLTTPALILIDDKDASKAHIISLLETIKNRKKQGKIRRPVRVVLLSRPDSVESWRNKLHSSSVRDAVDAREVELSSLPENLAFELFGKALTHLGKFFGKESPQIASEAFAEWFKKDPQVSGQPLYTIAAAAQTVLDPDSGLGFTAREIMDSLADRELNRLGHSTEGMQAFPGSGRAKVAGRLAALAAVRGALSAKVLKRLAAANLGMSLPSENEIIDALRALPWWRDGQWTAPEPRIIGNAIVWKVLEDEEDQASDWLFAALEPAGDEHFSSDTIIERLGRLVYDVGLLYGVESQKKFRSVLIGVVVNVERARALDFFAYADLPPGLADLGIAVAERLLTDDLGEPQRAHLLNNLSNRLRNVGRMGDALAPIEASVDIYRRLAEQDPARFECDFASSLNTLSNMLSAVGRVDDALAPIEAAVEIRRRLAQQASARFESDLAMSLNNLSIRLREVGRVDDTLAPSEASVDIYRRLAHQQPARFEYDFAMSLDTLSNMLSAVGRVNDALVPIEESVEIYRRLAQQLPARFEPDFAMILDTLSHRLSEVGRESDAVASSGASVDICRRLAQQQPARFEPDLARSLTTWSTALGALGRMDDALASIEEAVEIQRRLAQQHSARFEPELAKSLGLLSRARDR